MTRLASESIFDGPKTVIPMADVTFIAKSQHVPGKIFVHLRSKAPLMLLPSEAFLFLEAWCAYRSEIDPVKSGAPIPETADERYGSAKKRVQAGEAPEYSRGIQDLTDGRYKVASFRKEAPSEVLDQRVKLAINNVGGILIRLAQNDFRHFVAYYTFQGRSYTVEMKEEAQS